MGLDAAIRADDATGVRYALIMRDRLDGVLDADQRHLSGVGSTCGYPLVWRRVTPQAGVSAAGKFPDDGDGAFESGSTTGVLQLDSGGTYDQDNVGLRIFVQTGSYAGESRLIRSYSSKAATVGPASSAQGRDLPGAVAAADEYVLGVDSELRSEGWFCAEFENDGQECEIVPLLFSFPCEPSAGTAVTDGVLGIKGTLAPTVIRHGDPIILTGDGLTYGSQESGYYQSNVVGTAVRGAHAIGAYLKTAPASGAVALYIAAV